MSSRQSARRSWPLVGTTVLPIAAMTIYLLWIWPRPSSRDVSVNRVENENGLGPGKRPPRPRSFTIGLPIASFHQAELVVTAGSSVKCLELYVAGRVGRLEQPL